MGNKRLISFDVLDRGTDRWLEACSCRVTIRALLGRLIFDLHFLLLLSHFIVIGSL